MLPALHDTGSGEAVLFLHAFTLDASQWDHQVAALSDHLRCVRADLWGCGASPPPPEGEPTLDAFAAAVLAALDSRNIERVAVVGLSMGGYLAFALWRLAPQRISALVLCNTRATADAAGSRDERLAMAEQVEREQSVESIVEPMVERLLSPGAQAEAQRRAEARAVLDVAGLRAVIPVHRRDAVAVGPKPGRDRRSAHRCAPRCEPTGRARRRGTRPGSHRRGWTRYHSFQVSTQNQGAGTSRFWWTAAR